MTGAATAVGKGQKESLKVDEGRWRTHKKTQVLMTTNKFFESKQKSRETVVSQSVIMNAFSVKQKKQQQQQQKKAQKLQHLRLFYLG